MLIDWFTVVAQLINFLILVWLLKRFLYKPILKAIDAREANLASRVQEVEHAKVEADRIAKILRQEKEQLEHDQTMTLQKAAAEAEAHRKQLIEAAHKEVEALQAKWHEAVAIDRRKMSSEISRRIQGEVMAIAEKALAELGGVNVDEQIAVAFLSRLRRLPQEQKDKLLASLRASRVSVVIRTAHSLSESVCSTFETALRDEFPMATKLTFEVSAELIGGIELITEREKISWNAAEYLFALQEKAQEVVK